MAGGTKTSRMCGWVKQDKPDFQLPFSSQSNNECGDTIAQQLFVKSQQYRKGVPQCHTRLMINHYLPLQAKPIFSPVGLGQVRSGQRLGQKHNRPCVLMWCFAWGFPCLFNCLAWQNISGTMPLWSKVPIYGLKLRLHILKCWGHGGKWWIRFIEDRVGGCCTTTANILPPWLRAAVILPATRLLGR